MLRPLLAALLDFGYERDVMIHPTCHSGPGHPSGLGCFTVRTGIRVGRNHVGGSRT